ncbi:hypothetical protein AB205_0113700 [Aquarana catesbeiana]|uniref:Uncharacterized protein n=1 Tax=Aquarana catesbeiana TaxID=8400 RepID=A0A2G9R7M3_AQUCT|nr:hypothetical protein AB205_0113700 [Aquarana catesbeiana]
MFHIYSSAIKYLCAKYTIFLHIGEKRLGGHPSSEETRDPPPLEEGEIPQTQEEQEEEDVVELVTTTGDRDVVDPGHFTSKSAQILIGVIMGCNFALENITKNINDVIKKIRTSLMFWGEFKTPPNPFLLWCATTF